jgi:hypothetical protein
MTWDNKMLGIEGALSGTCVVQVPGLLDATIVFGNSRHAKGRATFTPIKGDDVF